jgi:hypothetical protein
VEEVVGKGVGEEAGLASGEAGEGDGRPGSVGVEVFEPEADGSGVAVEAALTAGLASDEAGDEALDGGGVEEGEEGRELGGVPPMLEGVEVAFGGAGAGSFASPSATLRTGPSAGLRAGPRPFGVAQDRHGWSLPCECERGLVSAGCDGGLRVSAEGGSASGGESRSYGCMVGRAGERWKGEVAGGG